MSYHSKIEESKNRGYKQAIARTILELMNKLRREENKNSSRRWVWELMQNAKDVAYDDIGVSIEINFQENGKEGFLEFKHNGKPFSIDNLTFLIEQISTKEREPQENGKLKTTGKFGTGFLTTHLLSEIVKIEGIVKEPEEPYKKINLSLDRSGRTIDDIIASVNKSLVSLKNIDSQPAFDQYSPTEFSTVFRYKLNESGIEVAKEGLRDLFTSLFFTLAFLPEIKSVAILNDGTRYELSQTIEKLATEKAGEYIKIYTVTLHTQNEKLETKIAILSENYTYIAAQIEERNDQICLKEFNSSTPRLFCDFPLIGTEDGQGRSVSVRPQGGSMRGLIESGQLVILTPVELSDIAVGDVVFVRWKGNYLLHLVKDIQNNRYLIGNNVGKLNGWVAQTDILARATPGESSFSGG